MAALAQRAVIIDRASSAGAVAQLGERLVRNEEVRGSNPLGSTKPALLLKQAFAKGRLYLIRDRSVGRQALNQG